MSAPTVDQLSDLVALITNAVAVVKNHSQVSTSHSHEEPQHSVKAANPDVRRAIWAIEGACAQLVAQIARPHDVLVNKFFAFYEPACLNVILNAKIPDVLQDHPSGLHISELEKKTGLPQQKLGRILRLLATRHVFKEVSNDVFANNYLSNHLVSSNPLSMYGLHQTDECFKASTNIFETLADPKFGPSMLPEHSPFSKYFNVSGTLFDYYNGSQPDQVKRGTRFGPGLIAWGEAIQATSVVHDFPWKNLKKGTTVCDVGGGIGAISMELARCYPALRLTLQDLPENVERAQREIWPEKCHQALQEQRIEFIPLDFFHQPPKAGCDIYFMKNVLHDWNDDDCVRILTQVRKAMKPHSRLLIHEFIIQHASRSPSGEAGFNQASEPLLPNYGDGRIRQYAMDLTMMALLNSQERTLDEFVKLGKAADLHFVKLWDIGEMCLLEFFTGKGDE